MTAENTAVVLDRYLARAVQTPQVASCVAAFRRGVLQRKGLVEMAYESSLDLFGGPLPRNGGLVGTTVVTERRRPLAKDGWELTDGGSPRLRRASVGG